jgi:hypothetical protein
MNLPYLESINENEAIKRHFGGMKITCKMKGYPQKRRQENCQFPCY